MRILLTGAGGPSAVSVWKSLHPAHELHMADMDPCAAGLYLVPAEQRLIVPRGDNPEFAHFLFEACRARSVEILISTVDAELIPLAEAGSRFVASGIKLALAPLPSLQLCRDKLALLTRLQAVVAVPASLVLTEKVAGSALQFPMFAKPRFSAGSRGAVAIEAQKDLDALPWDGSYLLQEMLPGAEYSVDMYVRTDGRVIAAVPRERMKTDSGIAITARTVRNSEIVDMAVRAVREAGLRYVANVQFKRAKNGALKLLEINPRFPGTLPLTARAGVDIPALLVADLLGEPLPDAMMPFEEIMVVRYWAEHFLEPEEWRQLCPR